MLRPSWHRPVITSLSNPRVKHVRHLQGRRRARETERRYVFEGVRLVEELVGQPSVADFVFFSGTIELEERGRHLLAALRSQGTRCYEVSEHVLQSCSDTSTPQGVLAVVRWPQLSLPSDPTFSLVVDRVRDPGNLGTILRSAVAAGADLVLLAPGTVDGSNPKAVRAGMGAHLRLPIRRLAWPAIQSAVSRSKVWLATIDGERAYTSVDWTGRCSLVVGGEASGPSQEARSIAAGTVVIPMAEGIDSLNAAVAASVIMFELSRQRQDHPVSMRTARDHLTTQSGLL
jgi:TrmH family RNA methyltransferase